eukprot:g1883.t1
MWIHGGYDSRGLSDELWKFNRRDAALLEILKGHRGAERQHTGHMRLQRPRSQGQLHSSLNSALVPVELLSPTNKTRDAGSTPGGTQINSAIAEGMQFFWEPAAMEAEHLGQQLATILS